MKSKILLTSAIVSSLFLTKVVDDIKSERAFDKAFAENYVQVTNREDNKNLISQKIKLSQSSTQSEYIEDDLSDVEELDFYNNSTVTILKNEKFNNENNKEETSNEFLSGMNHTESQTKVSTNKSNLPKKVSNFKLVNKSSELLKKLVASEEERQGLSLKDPVTLKKISVQKLRSTNWASLNVKVKDYKTLANKEVRLANQTKTNSSIKTYYSNSKAKMDRISMKMSSNEKSRNEVLNTLENDTVAGSKLEVFVNEQASTGEKDDLVFFDYSVNEGKKNLAKNSKNTQVMTKPKSSGLVVSNFVKDITRVQERLKADSSKKKSNKNSNETKWDISEFEKVAASIAKEKGMKEYDKLTGFSKSKKSTQEKINLNSEYILQVYNAKTNEDLRNFDVRFNDDEDEILNDNGSGEVIISKKLQNNNGIRRTTILSRGNIPTTIDVVLEDGEVTASVPVFSRKHFGQIMDSQNLRGNGAALLIELDKNTEDVDIDAKYEAKIYFNEKLKVVSPGESEYAYIMLVGINPGNTIVSFKTVKNKYISKIIHLSDEEIYYDPNFYIELKKDSFDLVEEHLLSKTSNPLSVDVKEVSGLIFDSKVKKLTMNKYQVSKTTYPIGIRSYLQLDHLDESLYIGRWNNNIVKVPSESYMRYVLDQFSVKSVTSQCLVQINLRKSAKELYYNGLSTNRGMRVQSKILDNDGIFYGDLSSESEKIFLLGEEQGIINVQVKYADGTQDYLQSYCSDSTYLVEQL